MLNQEVYNFIYIYQSLNKSINQYLSAPCARRTLGPIAPCSTVRMTKLWAGVWVCVVVVNHDDIIMTVA